MTKAPAKQNAMPATLALPEELFKFTISILYVPFDEKRYRQHEERCSCLAIEDEDEAVHPLVEGGL
ncbi:hypothetical protein EJB05_22343, partial [Eragrostis curvula]